MLSVETGGEKEEEGDVWSDAIHLPKSLFHMRSPAVLGWLSTCLPMGSGNEFLVLLYLLKCLYLNAWALGFFTNSPPSQGRQQWGCSVSSSVVLSYWLGLNHNP